MKKILMLTMLAWLLVGCETKTTESGKKGALPEGLKDCKVYNVRVRNYYGNLSGITVVRCPNSNTSTNFLAGKTSNSVTLVEE